MLVAILDPAHGMAKVDRERGHDDIFGRQPRLRAEPAANVGRDDTDLALLNAEHFAQAEPHDVGRLRRTVEHQRVEPMIPMRERGATLRAARPLGGACGSGG